MERITTTPETIEESVSRPFIVLTDEDLDKKLLETNAVETLLSLDAWQLVHQAMRRKADVCYRKLAATRDMDEITQLQAWLRCYQDLTQNLRGFIESQEELVREQQLRKRGIKYFIDRWRPKQEIANP